MHANWTTSLAAMVTDENVAVVGESALSLTKSANVVRSLAKQIHPFGADVANVKMMVPLAQEPLALNVPAVFPPTWVLIAQLPEFTGDDPLVRVKTGPNVAPPA